MVTEMIRPMVPKWLMPSQEFLVEALKVDYYGRQSLIHIGLSLGKFFQRPGMEDGQAYKVITTSEGDVGEVRVVYREKGLEDILVLIIKRR